MSNSSFKFETSHKLLSVYSIWCNLRHSIPLKPSCMIWLFMCYNLWLRLLLKAWWEMFLMQDQRQWSKKRPYFFKEAPNFTLFTLDPHIITGILYLTNMPMLYNLIPGSFPLCLIVNNGKCYKYKQGLLGKVHDDDVLTLCNKR